MANTIATTSTATTHDISISYLDEMTSTCEKMMQQYWVDNLDLYRIVQLKNQATLAANTSVKSCESPPQDIAIDTPDTTSTPSLLNDALRGAPLCARIRENQQHIRQRVLAAGADIIPRTQAHNRKCTHHSVEEARESRADVVAAQIQSWRRLLPNLMKRFSRIPDYRRAESVKHKITVLMMFGLFAFIFRLSSRREMNRELTGPVIFDHLIKFFSRNRFYFSCRYASQSP